MCNGAEKIQDAELEVMQVLWSAPQPVPLIHIRQALAASGKAIGCQVVTISTTGEILAVE